MYLSKKDYMLACRCEKALWLKKEKYHPEPANEDKSKSSNIFWNQVLDLARKRYPSGIFASSDDNYIDIIENCRKTRSLSENNEVLFNAWAELENGAHSKVDILERNGKHWNLIKITQKGSLIEGKGLKSAIRSIVLPELAFTRYVFENAGYSIDKCYVLHLNGEYVRSGDIDIQKLFILSDLSDEVAEFYQSVSDNIDRYLKIATMDTIPDVLFHKECRACKKWNKESCPYIDRCGQDIPEYSIFDLLSRSGEKADKIYAKYKTANIEDIPEDELELSDTQKIDRDTYLNKSTHVDKDKIAEWLSSVEYPVYYLDYETINPAIPQFDGSKPHQQIPFQFSLHVQREKGAECEHIGFLHKSPSDPRKAFAERLIENCGNKGSVVVYTKAEKTWNEALAKYFESIDCKDIAKKILAINERIKDLEEPFKERYLYSYKQNGSSSIKKVLPAFADLSYDGMNISDGMEASSAYLKFLLRQQTKEESSKMFSDLEKYCRQDTYAMVLLMRELYRYAEQDS